MTPNFSNILSAADDNVDLRKLDPREFREYDRWFRFMVRCFHSGVTREDFVAWSCSDPEYASDADRVGRRWDRLKG
jgi:Mesyanzhinovviridae bifunctional DNA primase/polymerase